MPVPSALLGPNHGAALCQLALKYYNYNVGGLLKASSEEVYNGTIRRVTVALTT